MAPLRDYQAECINALASYAREGGRRALVALPTGTGKTVIFAAMAAAAQRGRVLVIAHREELIDQSAAKLREAAPGLTVGIEQATRHANGARAVVASIQTLAVSPTRLSSLVDGGPPFSLVVVDEAHHSIATTYLQALARLGLAPVIGDLKDADLTARQVSKVVRERCESFRPAPDAPLLVGFTATPHRTDGRGLEYVYDEIVFQRAIGDMIRAGWLETIRGERVTTETDITGVRTHHGDYAERALSAAVNTQPRNELVVQAYQDHAAGRQALVFAVDVAHTQALAGAFSQAGLRAGYVVGDKREMQAPRTEVIAAYRAGDLDVLVNCMVLTEGFDAPETSAVIMARPTKSQLLYTQMLGRGTRLAPGKADLVVIDLVDVAKAGVANVNTLFGRPPNLEWGDADIVEVLDESEGAEDAVPADMWAGITSLDELRTAATAFDPLAAARPPAGVSAQYAWVRTPYGLALSLPGPERQPGQRGYQPGPQIGLIEDMLGRYTIRVRDGWARTVVLETGVPDMQVAVYRAEDWVGEHHEDAVRLIDRDARWRRDAPSEKQVAYARRLGITVADGMTKGDVSALIDAGKSRRAM